MQFSFAVLSALIIPLISAQTTTLPVTGTLGNATVVSDNPVGPVYQAVLPEKSFFDPSDPRGNIKGSITATANANGTGVLFEVKFSNLPTSGGPFVYHLHVDKVPENGNCTDTLGHIDPFIRGETPACDASQPETCQVGDLAGKHGAITSDPFTAQYVDEFASTQEGLGSFFGNRSFVVHFANVTRITCANFAEVGTNGLNSTNSTSAGNSSTGTSSSTSTSSASSSTATTPSKGNSTSTSSSSLPKSTINSASSVGASTFGMVGAMALAALFL